MAAELVAMGYAASSLVEAVLVAADVACAEPGHRPEDFDVLLAQIAALPCPVPVESWETLHYDLLGKIRMQPEHCLFKGCDAQREAPAMVLYRAARMMEEIFEARCSPTPQRFGLSSIDFADLLMYFSPAVGVNPDRALSVETVALWTAIAKDISAADVVDFIYLP